MPRGLDHIVHAVHDLDAAADLCRNAGFTVGARNRHPPAWGTENHIVQLPGFFVELLAVAEPAGIAPHGPRSLSFGAFNRDFLVDDQGLSMLVLASNNAADDATAFRTAGISDFDVFDFSREARRPNGEVVKVAFSLAFAQDTAAPKAGFFTCQQHYPENFWNPAFQNHANTVEHVAGVVMVANEPLRHRDFLLAYTGVDSARGDGDGFHIGLPRGAIDVMTPAVFTHRFGLPAPKVVLGPRLAALRFSVGEISTVKTRLEQCGIAATAHPGALAAAFMGAVLVFERPR